MSVILPTRMDQRIVYTDNYFRRVQIDMARPSTSARGAIIPNACAVCGGVEGDYRVISQEWDATNGEGRFLCSEHAARWLPGVRPGDHAMMLEYIDPALCVIDAR